MNKIALLALNLLIIISFNANAQNGPSEAFSKSYTYEYNKEYNKAISALSTHYDNESYEVNLRLGWLHYAAGEYPKSLNYYQTAVKLKPKSIEAKLGLVYPAAALQNWEEVIDQYENILKIDQQNSTANFKLAEIYFYRKDFNKAINYVLTVQNLYPFDYSSNVLAGKIQIGLGKISEAKVSLKKALLYDPTSAEVKTLLEKLE